jgi:hypothetical protein
VISTFSSSNGMRSSSVQLVFSSVGSTPRLVRERIIDDQPAGLPAVPVAAAADISAKYWAIGARLAIVRAPQTCEKHAQLRRGPSSHVSALSRTQPANKQCDHRGSDSVVISAEQGMPVTIFFGTSWDD